MEPRKSSLVVSSMRRKNCQTLLPLHRRLMRLVRESRRQCLSGNRDTRTPPGCRGLGGDPCPDLSWVHEVYSNSYSRYVDALGRDVAGYRASKKISLLRGHGDRLRCDDASGRRLVRAPHITFYRLELRETSRAQCQFASPNVFGSGISSIAHSTPPQRSIKSILSPKCRLQFMTDFPPGDFRESFCGDSGGKPFSLRVTLPE